MALNAVCGPVEQLLRERLTAALAPAHLELVNESYKHAVASGAETHFKVLVVAQHFEGLSVIERHRAVNDAVRGNGAEFPVCVFSLSLFFSLSYF